MCDELFDWAFGDNEDDLNEALLQARLLPVPLSTSLFGDVILIVPLSFHLKADVMEDQ